MFTSKAQRMALEEASRLLLAERSDARNARKFVVQGIASADDKRLETYAALATEAVCGRIPIGLPDIPCVLVELHGSTAQLFFVERLAVGASFCVVRAGGGSSVGVTGVFAEEQVREPADSGLWKSLDHRSAQRGMVKIWGVCGFPSARVERLVTKQGVMERTASSAAMEICNDCSWVVMAGIVQILLYRSAPTGYIFRATAKESPLKRDRRLFKPGQSALVMIGFDRLWTIYGGTPGERHPYEYNHRDGHTRHLWRRVGLSWRDMVGLSVSERTRIAIETKVPRILIQPWNREMPKAEDDLMIYEAMTHVNLPPCGMTPQNQTQPLDDSTPKIDDEGDEAASDAA